jgi:hypothetical protein
MSQDLPAYITMRASTSSTFNDEYIPQTDEAELARMQGMASLQGLGEVNLEDDELSGFLGDFGYQAPNDDLR